MNNADTTKNPHFFISGNRSSVMMMNSNESKNISLKIQQNGV
jgi:hypothetical protein